MRDRFGREVDYLRISVTDRCNFRCLYCSPSPGTFVHIPRSQILTYEEIEKIVRLGGKVGVREVRITGGEPLLRRGLPHLIEKLARIKEIERITLTTNGIYLELFARVLAQAGLKGVNVSLDTLNEEKFRKITGYGGLSGVLAGLREAQEVGLSPIKVNMVIMRGINDDEIFSFVNMARETPFIVKFVELMKANTPLWEERFIPNSLIKEKIEKEEGLFPLRESLGKGPARYFRLGGKGGIVGFINPVSEERFCYSCNRLRLDARGVLKACLFSSRGIDLRTPLREEREEEVKTLLEEAVRSKSLKREEFSLSSMAAIGG